MKYEYKFEKIEIKSGFWSNSPKEPYHEIIEEYASQGWRLVQIFAPAMTGYGTVSYIEIIFERTVKP